MKFFSTLMIVLSGLLVGNSLLASTSYVEALRCHERFVIDLGEVNAAILCRGVESNTATAVANCVSEGKARTSDNKAVALLCQGISYRIMTATVNCYDDAVVALDPVDAASLCQRTDYRVYTAKMNCLSAAKESMSSAAAGELCGGVSGQ